MDDNDLTITALTADEISALDQHQLSLPLADSMLAGAADISWDLTSVDAGDLTVNWNSLNQSGLSLGPLMSDTITNPVHPSSRITLTGDDADIEINGESVMGVLKEIRDRLGIIQVSETMEEEWDELRQLREQYEAKLAECQEKSRAWSALKQMPPPTIP